MKQIRFPIFAERFNSLRGEKTQGEFADFIGISRPTVGFYENGERIPDALTLRQIAEKCGVSADWLIGLSEIKSPDITLQGICKYTGFIEATVVALHDNVLKQEQTNDRREANGHTPISRPANKDMSIVVYELLKSRFCDDLFAYCLCPPDEQGVITFQTKTRRFQYMDNSDVILASYRLRLHSHIDSIAEKLRSERRFFDKDGSLKIGDLSLIDSILKNGDDDDATDEEHP